MIFQRFKYKILDKIDLIVDFLVEAIEIEVRWNESEGPIRFSISYRDDESTLPNSKAKFYLFSCSSSSIHQEISPSFFPYWFVLEKCFFRRIFPYFNENEEKFVILLCLEDGRILSIDQNEKNEEKSSKIWFRSSSFSPTEIFGFRSDLNENFLDAILTSSEKNSIESKMISNHLIVAESTGTISILNSRNVRRIVLDRSIRSICFQGNSILYLTENQLKSIEIFHLLKSSNEKIVQQTKIRRFSRFEKIFIDGQEAIVHHENGSLERLKILYGPSIEPPLRIQSINNAKQRLIKLTEKLSQLQSNVNSLQRFYKKIQSFYQIDLTSSLKIIENQWKFVLDEKQSRQFQPEDFIFIFLYQISGKFFSIEQFKLDDRWNFTMKSSISRAVLCRPIIFLRHQKQFFSQIGKNFFLLPNEKSKIEKNFFFNEKKFKTIRRENFHLSITIRNEPARKFQTAMKNEKKFFSFPKIFSIGRSEPIEIDLKQQQIKVDTENGLVDATIVQIVCSTSSLVQLIVFFSHLVKLLNFNRQVDEKFFIKQNDVHRVLELIQYLQKIISNDHLDDDALLNLLQIRIYLSMFALGSDFTVQVS